MDNNWGEPNETSFGSGLDDQYAFELFYRLQLTKDLAVTPDVQEVAPSIVEIVKRKESGGLHP